jgi:CspA family cold shock protein
MEFQDQTLPCDACGGEFVFRASEQAFFAEKAFSAPRRCMGARKAKKATGRTERYDACPFGTQASGDGARPAARPAPRPARAPVAGTGVYRSGEVLKVLADRGFGFLRGEDDQDYYFDESALEVGEFRRIQPGARVTFEVANGMRGPRAANVAMEA